MKSAVLLAVCWSFSLIPLYFIQGAGLGISPLNFEMNVNRGDTLVNSVRIFNQSEYAVTVQMDAEDFRVVGEEGRVVVSELVNQTYSLAKWITIEPAVFTLEPAGQQLVNFTITVPLNGEPGGHYGSILAQIIGTPGGGGGVGITQKIGSLVLLQVAGEVKEQMWIKSFEVPSFLEHGPVSLVGRFENLGSVHVKARGFVTIIDLFGREKARIPLEEKNVLPNSLRRIETVWDTKWQLGRFTATLTAIYGSTNEPLTATKTFWIIPVKIVGGAGFAFLILAVLSFLMRKRIGLALSILLKGDRK